MSRSLLRRPTARRDASGFTLVEIILTLAVISLIMVPVLAWTVMAFQRSNDNSVSSDTRTFTELSRYVDRDLAAAKSVLRWEPAPALPLADPCPVDTVAPAAGEDKVVIDVATQQTWLVILDSKGRNVVYLTDKSARETDGNRPTRLIRRACVNGSNQPAAVIAERVTDLPAPAGSGTVPVSVSCTNRVGYTADSDVCGQLTLKVKGAKGAVVTVKSNRRLRAVRDITLQPVADIRCAPSCTEFRGAGNTVDVVLDGSYSSSPVGTPTYAWSFDDPTIPRQTGDRTDTITLTCTNTMARWNPAIKGCTYKATLTITDPRGQTATRDQNLTVLNASPVVAVTPLGVNGFRSEWVCFDASGTVDADDPTGSGLTFSWAFDDPTSAANSATGPGTPVADCNSEYGAPGVVSHQYTVLTGSSQRTAVLTVTDAEGVVQTVRIPIRIENKPPVAVITSTVSGVDLPSGEIIWDGSQSSDPDGNAAHDGPSNVATYEWNVTDANGNAFKCCDESVATNVQGVRSSTLRLPAPGITSAGIYTVTLRVTDAEGQSASTTRVVSTNTRPRAVISKRTPDKALITPENGEDSYTLDGGPNGADPGSFDVDQGGFIKTYKWEFWTAGTTTPPTQACTAAVAPPCYLDGGTSPTITFGPAQVNRVPYGTYRVKLVVTDDNNATNTCASVSPYSSSCIDNPAAASPQRWWTDLKINRAPRLTQATATPTICCTSAPTTPAGLRQPYRRTSIQFGTTSSTDPANPTKDDDGSIVSYTWTFTKVGGANAPLLGSPTLNIANPVVQFVEPEKDYVVNAKLRVVDNDGAFTEFTQPLFVRNKPPVASITVGNSQTALPPVNNSALNSWATPDPVNQPARFQFNARGSSDADGYVQGRYWRIFKVPTSGAQTQIAEFTDYNTNGVTCQFFSGTPTLDDPNVANCGGFFYDFKEYGTFRVQLETLDNDGGKSVSSEVLVKVNTPPTITDFTVCPQLTGVTCPPFATVQNVDGAQGGFTFTPTAVPTVAGSTIKTYYWEWDDGTSPTNNSTAAAQLHRFDSTNPGVSTGKNGQWNVKLTVVDSENGTASLTKLVRFNRRPTAGISTTGSTGLTYQNLPVWRLSSCTPSGTFADTGVCTLPAVDASSSTDPDAQTTPAIAEYRWFTPSYALANPGAGILTFNNGAQATGASSTFPSSAGTFNIGYNSFEGVQVFLGVKDGDNAWSSTGAGFRVTANRAPRLLKVDSPTASGTNGTVQRNVPTTFRVSTLDDLWFGATVTNFTLSFKDALGNPVTFLNASGASVTSVSGSAALEANGAGKPNCTTVGTGSANGSTWCPVVTLPNAANDLTAVLTATDSDGASITVNNAVKYNVVDANPVAVVTATDPAGAANPTVLSSTSATPPAFTITLDGSTSFDPDGSPGFTSSPVSAFSWTTVGPTGTVGSGCTTGKIGPSTPPNPPTVPGQQTCTLPAVYGTYTVNLTVYDAGGRTGSTDWVVKVNRTPVVSNLVAAPNPAQGLVPVTFTATASDPDGTISAYRWDFNADGVVDQTTASSTTTYTYPAFRPLTDGTNVYTASVVAVDNDGGLSTDNAGGLPVPARTTSVTVNRQPVAAFTINRTNGGDCGAASPCVVNLPTPYSVSVNGTANTTGGSSDDDGSVTAYAWTITTVSGSGTAPTLGGVPSGSLTFPGPGLYSVTLQVTDNNSGTGQVTRQVRVNTAPVVTLGGTPPYTCVRQPSPSSPASCTITASATDAENDAISSYTWEFLDAGGTRIGSLVTTATGSVSPVFTSTGTGTVKVYATDANGGQSPTVSAAFTVANQPPTVSVATNPTPATITPTNAGAPQFVTLTATAADPDGGTISYAWSVKNAGGTEVLTGSASTLQVGPGAASPLPAGRYDVTVTVSDGQGGSTTSSVVPVIVNQAPNAVATATPSVVNDGTSPDVTFDGSGSSDPDGGSIVSYAWTITGPGGFSTTATGATPAAVTLGSCGAANPCNFVATLTTTDNDGGVSSTTVVVKRNKLPVPGATLTPAPQTTPATPACTLAAATTCVSNPPGDLHVDAASSTDPDGSLVDYSWKLFDAAALVSNPNVAPVQTLNGQNVDFTRPAGGLYVVELTVTDDSGASAVLRGNVNVNRAPTVSIDGASTLLVDRLSPFNFTATASDPDGDTLTSYQWTYTSGATVLATETTSDPSSVQVFNVLVPNGTVTLKVTDPSGASTTVSTSFEVRNQVPRAVLNQDPTDTVGTPGYTVTFSSSSLDNDGQVLTATLQVCPDPAGGPGCASYDLLNGSSTVAFPDYGTYTLNFSVTDDDGATGTLTPVPTIKINRPPTAVIANSGSLTVPVNVNLTLDGTPSTDPDGTIAQYLWVFDSGPAALAPGSGSQFTQQFTVAGTYVVRLIVFDDSGVPDETTANIVVTP